MKSSKIKSITSVGVKNVFDLEVEKDHNYFANGILAHNCSYHELLDYYGKKYNDDLYRVKDTFISYKHRRLLMYPAGPNKKTLRGRCLVGSTIINTNKGFAKLSNIISKDGQHPVDNLFVDSHTGQQKVTHTFMESVTETIKIKTTNGFTIEGTLEHPIYVKSANGEHEWKRLEDIVNGDAIMSMGHEQNPVWGLSTVPFDVSKIPDEYPKELLSATRESNKNFIENLIASHAKEDFESIAIAATENFLADLQVILFHGFFVLSQNEGETLKIQKSQLNNLQSNLLDLFCLDGKLVSNHNHYEVVCSKKLVVKEQFVYDVTVPQGHAFMANGLVSHNTRFLCLAAGTLVNVDSGLCKIEDVKAGDYTYFGNFKRKIISTTASGVQKIFKVVLSNGMQISCTSDHKFLAILDSSLKEFWVKAKDLQPSMHVLVTLGGSFSAETVKVNVEGKTFELDEKFARLLALLVKATYYKIKEDQEILKLLSDIFEGETATVVEGGIVLTSLQSKVLESFGYNLRRNVPQALQKSPEKVVREFLIECFSNKNLNIYFGAMQEYRSILLKFGIIAHSVENTILLSDYEYSKLKGEPCSKNMEFSPYNLPYAYKYCTRLEQGIVYCQVLSVIDTNKEEKTFDVCVDCEDHAFTANGFIVHNSAIDEIGWFDNQNDGKVKMDATQVYVALDRSLLTVRAASRRLIMQGFDDIANGYAFNVSSPSSARDKIVELVSQSKNSKKIFGFKCATWEMNPNITKDDLSEEYAKNPVDAERDYACNPPLSDNAFIPSFTSIEDCFIGKPNKVRYKYAQRTMRDGTVTRFAKVDEIAKSTKPNVLAIDAGYCVVGDTLIPTNMGLRRIDSLVNLPEGAEEGYSSSINLRVGGRYQAAPVARWHYMGVKPTIRITTASGHSLAGTGNHPQLILRGADHVWVKLSDLKVGDIACFNPTQSLRQKPLKLRLTKPARTTAVNNTSGVHGVYKSRNRWSVILYLDGIRTNVGNYETFDEAVAVRNKTAKTYNLDSGSTSQIKIKVPTHMTESLAYFIGALISEGSFKKYQTEFSNTNKAYREKVESCVEEVFGLLPVKTKTLKGAAYCINGREGHTNKSCQSLIWSSKSLCDILRQLGVVESTHGHKTSYHKVIPDCILQADANSQLAFMAAYIEGDGQVYKDRHHIAVWSKSDELLKKFQILLNSHGVMSYIRKDSLNSASAHDAVKLFNLISPYMQHKKHKLYRKRSGKVSNNYGVDASFLYSFFASRFVKRSKAGLTFRTDAGGEFAVKGLYKSLNKQLSYEKYKSGGYSLMLHALEHISKEMKDKVEKLLNLEYSYSEIVDIQSGGKEKVYDLTMEDGYEPAFIANGMVIHNTGNSFGAACMHQHEGTPILNSLLEVMPNPGVPLNHALIFREALHTMIRERNVKVLLADRWQSIKLLQDAEIEFEGLVALQYSLKYNDFWMLKQVMFDAEIVFPKIKRPMDEILKFDQSKYPYCFTDPIEHFAVQCITVRDMGNTIAKGDGLTDDLFRAVSLAAWAFQSGQFEEILDGDGEEEGSKFTGALGYMAGRSSATSVSNDVHTSNGKVVGYMTSKR